ncbi:porin, partial [Rhizobium alvei]
MNIKSLLLGSAAALAVVSGAQAADAVVAAEPEPMEYVKVCDAYGTGFFYIPGTETCLKIGGQFRYEKKFKNLAGPLTPTYYYHHSRARLHVEAKNDSE